MIEWRERKVFDQKENEGMNRLLTPNKSTKVSECVKVSGHTKVLGV